MVSISISIDMLALWVLWGLANVRGVTAQTETYPILSCSTWLLGHQFNEVYPHHGHIDVLWNDDWHERARTQAEPFYDANVTDFEPIFADLIERKISDAYNPAYTRAFLPTAHDLLRQAEEAEQNNNAELAGELYTRAAVVLRIARYPNPVTPTMLDAWHQQVDAYFKSAKYLDPPVHSVHIPHTHRANGDGATIPVATRHSIDEDGSSPSGPRPVILFVTGLDEFRTDFNPLTHWAVSQGWEVVVMEMPGTADCPSNRSDPSAGDRLWPSVLDWMEEQPQYDTSRIGVWTFSTGSYYGIRMAHTLADRLHAVVTQGGAVHKGFEAEWMRSMDYHEYAFAATPSLLYKFGYNSAEEMWNRTQTDYSLVLDGTFDMNHTQLLMINGMHDSFFPAEDTFIPTDFGWPKLAKVFPEEGHMGGEPGFELAQNWLKSVM